MPTYRNYIAPARPLSLAPACRANVRSLADAQPLPATLYQKGDRSRHWLNILQDDNEQLQKLVSSDSARCHERASDLLVAWVHPPALSPMQSCATPSLHDDVLLLVRTPLVMFTVLPLFLLVFSALLLPLLWLPIVWLECRRPYEEFLSI